MKPSPNNVKKVEVEKVEVGTVPAYAFLIFCVAGMWCSAVGTPAWATLDADRKFDRLWAGYLPVLQQHFVRYLAFDDGTFDALQKRPGLTVRLRLHLDRQGRVREVRVLDKAALPRFTSACERAAQGMGRLPGLPPEVLDRGRREGIEFTFATQ